MGSSHQRDKHLEKIKRETTSAGQYVTALENSPYRTHRRVAVGLRAQLNSLSAETIAMLKKQEESNEFKKSLGLE